MSESAFGGAFTGAFNNAFTNGSSSSFDMLGLIGADDAAWYRVTAGTTSPVELLTDLSGQSNDFEASGTTIPTVATRYGVSYLQYDYLTVPSETITWPMNGMTGTFAFASIHGAQVFTLRPGTQPPRIQFIEAIFIARALDAGEQASLLAYMQSKCPTVLWNAEILGTEYNHDLLSYENPAGSFVLTFSDGQTAEAPPWDAPDFYTKLVTLAAPRVGLRFVSDDKANVQEYELDGETFFQTTSMVPANIGEYTECLWMEILGFIQGTLPPFSSYPQDGNLEYLAISSNDASGLCGDFPALEDIPPNLATLIITAPGMKWDTVNVDALPDSITTYGFHGFTTTGPMPALDTLPNVTSIDFRYVNFTAGSVPTLPTNLVRLDLHGCNRTGLAPNPGRFPSMYRYHFRENALTGFDEAVTISAACDYLNLESNALTQAAVDALLAAHVAANPTTVGKHFKHIALSGGTNATPSGAGLANKAIMQGRGWTVTTN